MASVKKLLEYLVRGQFGALIAAVGERIPSTVFRRGKAFIFEQYPNQRLLPATATALPEGYTVRPARRDEMPAVATITGIDVDEYYRRFDAGNICFTVFAADNRPVNINWVHHGSCFVRGMGYRHDADPKDAYIYGIMTHHSQRGKGLYKTCLVLLEVHLYASGDRRLVQMVEDGNAAVLHTLPKLGYRQTRMIRYLTLLGIRFTVTEDVDGSVRRTWTVGVPADVFRI